jgi:hypothetical protein
MDPLSNLPPANLEAMRMMAATLVASAAENLEIAQRPAALIMSAGEVDSGIDPFWFAPLIESECAKRSLHLIRAHEERDGKRYQALLLSHRQNLIEDKIQHSWHPSIR